jgi:bifunctional UDP-N-acetylglucosamine pyrophosphorylase/glucosamine-1-phosphate N-acetyltransferase
MDENLAIIVLAAGQGTRMKSATPKILHPLAGAPIIAHVLATARALDAAHVVAVVRHERDLVAAAIEAELPGAIIVDQDEVPGTGRAVEQAIAVLPDEFAGDVLVLNGDVPLLNASTLAELLERHRSDALAASVLSHKVHAKFSTYHPARVNKLGQMKSGTPLCALAAASRQR